MLRRKTWLNRSWHSADTCSSSVELTFMTVTEPAAMMVAVASRRARNWFHRNNHRCPNTPRPYRDEHADPSLHDDVEPVVHLAFLDDFLAHPRSPASCWPAALPRSRCARTRGRT